MALIKDGYWPDTYWAGRYWQEDYWPEYGTAVPPVSAPIAVWARRRRLPEPLLQALKKYLELKVDNS